MMKKPKWQLNRAGLLNFWYYDEEEFNFADGKLLLRGNNGSGKSVTMQSFIPVLLDGRKSPDRLDPFGSRARKMEDYLLGEKGVVDRDERTGYLYLEYKRAGLEQYLTTGIGLRAKRNSGMDFWGFLIFDNRRIGYDFSLYKNEYSPELGKNQKIPLTRTELENRLNEGGKVVRSQGEYMEMVNKHVFGFENLADYEELIKLLIQLRSPKLSKDFKPTVIYEILNESLPSLSDEELRPLSDTIENMDQTKQQLEQLEKERRSLSKLCRQYDQYNQFILVEKAEGLLKSWSDLQKLSKKEKELNSFLTSFQEELNKLKEKMRTLRQEDIVLKDEKSKLEKHEVFSVEKEKIALEQNITLEKQKLQLKKETLQKKEENELGLRHNIAQEEKRIQEIEKNIVEIRDELDNDATEGEFAGHELASREFSEKYQNAEYVFDLWKKEARDYSEKLEIILQVLEEQDRVKEKYQEADRELGEVRKNFDLKNNEARKWHDYFEEEKEKLLASIHQWRQKNQELLLSDLEIQEIARYSSRLYEDYSSEKFKEPVIRSYRLHYNRLQQNQVKLEQQIQAKKEEITSKEGEIAEWKRKKDPEPERHQDTIKARQYLDERNIPYLPFYQAVEYQDKVTSEQRERLEAAISQMGLLDALIVPEQYLSQVDKNDKVIKPNPQFFKHTLVEYLYPTPVEGGGVSAQDIDNVLRSILLEEAGEGAAVLKDDGSYQLALLKGHAPGQEASLYIGQEARRRYRQQMIARLTEELAGLWRQLDLLEQEQEKINERISRLEKEYHDFPLETDVKEAYDTWQRLVLEAGLYQKDVESKNNKVKTLLEQLRSIQDKLRGLVKGMVLPVTKEAYQTARMHMTSYLKHLQELELNYKDFTSSTRLLKQFKKNLTDTIDIIDELKGEMNVLQDNLQKFGLQLEKLVERLNIMGAEEIRQKINQVEKRLQEIPDELINLQNNISKKENGLENTQAQIVKLNLKQKAYEKLYKLWEEVLLEELKLGLVKKVSAALEKGEIIKIAREVKEQLGIISKDNIDRENLANRLNQTFYQEQGVLVEYRLTQEIIGELKAGFDYSPDLGEEREVIDFLFKDLELKARRIQLLMEYNGKKVSPYYVLEQLDKDIELQQTILNDKDRELYEEIIMNSVGRIIRGRINRAEEWVEKIDELMGQRNTSSGLTFSLRWKPLTAEWEDELDTKELVELLRLDPRLLKEQDMERITQHFRSKINRAKEIMVEKGYGETLHQIIKEMLDYRKWFSFTLYYQRTGEKKKELTNNVFYTFSGGEKAMAMYIPLFSAAYSRYLEAREDAPYIISLDEAFAGVDENNIRDMFDLVEKLGFNYIMNSQALWGDYDTVSSLSICELVRPQNAPFVTVVRYWWNGKRKELVLPKEKADKFIAAAK